MNKTKKNLKIKKTFFNSQNFRKNKAKKGGSSPSSSISSESLLSEASDSSSPSSKSSNPLSNESTLKTYKISNFKVTKKKKNSKKTNNRERLKKLITDRFELEVKLLSNFETKEDKQFINILINSNRITSENYETMSKIKNIDYEIKNMQENIQL